MKSTINGIKVAQRKIKYRQYKFLESKISGILVKVGIRL
ncbi:hypothetical protein IGI37_003833 [Enterococcus sp. AZ194]